MEIQNTTDALKALDDDEKTKLEVSPRLNLGVHKGVKEINIINESGLYALILRSRKAMQKGTVQHKFRKWVTSEVLPSIRKTGQYTINRLTSDDTLPLRNAVNMATGILKLDYATIYKMVHQRFGIDEIKELSKDEVGQAVEYVHGLMLNGLTKPQLSHATLERPSKQFSKTAILMNHIKNEYLPFLHTANYHRGEQFSSYLTLLKYDIEDNTRDLFSLLSDDIKTNKQHPITKHLEMAYYADNLLLCPSKAV